MKPAALLSLGAAPAVLAAAITTADTTSPTPTSSTTSPTTTGTDPDTCSAVVLAHLCDYEEPDYGTAAAARNVQDCFAYCNDHQPCSFFIFVRGNPYTGSGTCWLYPGEEYDPAKGTKDGCADPNYLTVYERPRCAGPDPRPSVTTAEDGYACAATVTPEPVAEVCGYPVPETPCMSCSAQLNVTGCLGQCARDEDCKFAVYNPGNDWHNPYRAGSCWMYKEGSFDESKAGKCDGKPEQFVYENHCPKPPKKKTDPTATGGGSSNSTEDAPSTTSSDSAGLTGSSLSHPLALGAVALIMHNL